MWKRYKSLLRSDNIIFKYLIVSKYNKSIYLKILILYEENIKIELIKVKISSNEWVITEDKLNNSVGIIN